MSRLTWSRERRLRKSPEFSRCFGQGRKFSSKSFLLFVSARPDGPRQFRLGMAVSRKMGRAVVRNRIKRVVREFFRLHQDRISGPLDIVLVPKRSLDADRLTLAVATLELAPLLTRLAGNGGRGPDREKKACAP
ncbi:MAG: ribonuclease P protein component [Desulfovibrio aminophilus]|uniref:ribonuclease P protein component n=1 Tax=Desulfovibrio aminophilus TaxID=81425 RepID=UPI0039E74DD9